MKSFPKIDVIVYSRFEVVTEDGGSYTLNLPIFCQQCGQCCRDISFPEPELIESILRLVLELKLIAPDYLERFNNKDLHSIASIKPCVFLYKNQCKIYPVRPLYCREWFPRVRSPCLAFKLHNKMGRFLLRDKNYHIGIREIIHISKDTLNSFYPQVEDSTSITKETLINYYSPLQEKALEIWNKFTSFNPSPNEQRIFLLINPGINTQLDDFQ